uniref:Uncharacterized protein n=1 Tax=Glossina pallidipes TaxID=7398 RepID=A0A1A9Z298_GLOPL
MIHQLSAGIGMEFAWEKCKTVNVKSGRVCEDEGLLSFNTGDILKSVNNKENFKYLGFLQLKIVRRLVTILKTKLNLKYKCEDINTRTDEQDNKSHHVQVRCAPPTQCQKANQPTAPTRSQSWDGVPTELT